MKKFNVEFVSYMTPYDEVTSNALLTQLMVAIAQIAIKEDSRKINDNDIIQKEM